MRTPAVISLFIIAVGFATLLHYKKKQHTTEDIDTITQTLSGISSFIKPGSSFYFSGDSTIQAYVQSRYILAPTPLLLVRDAKPGDTVLSIFPISSTLISPSSNILWQAKDKLYTYTLSIH